MVQSLGVRQFPQQAIEQGEIIQGVACVDGFIGVILDNRYGTLQNCIGVDVVGHLQIDQPQLVQNGQQRDVARPGERFAHVQRA